MKWVKGELLTDIDAPGVDPTRQLDRHTQPGLFSQRGWFARVWHHFPTATAAPIIARATSEGAIAWLFLVRHSGGRAAALANWYSFSFNTVYKGAPDPASRRAMVTAIATRLGKAKPSLSTITLAPVPRADGSSALIARAFTLGGWKAYVTQSSTSWTATVAGLTFAEYWAARPGQLRNTYARKRAKAAFDIAIFDRFDDASWEDYEAVYADSWKPDEGIPAFLRETAIYESGQGALRLGICKIDGQAVAAQFWTVENGIAYIHKLAHRDSAKALSPGTILSHAMFARVIDVDHVTMIDFGTGNDAYKADWMDKAEPLDEIILYNGRTISGLLGWMRHMLTSSLKSLLMRKQSDH